MKNKMVHVHQIKMGPSWMNSIMLFLKEDILPKGKFNANKVQRKAPQFWLFEDQKLYKCSFFGSYLLCTLRHQSYSWRSYLKGSVGATQDADRCLTKPSLRDIGGRTCKRKHKSM